MMIPQDTMGKMATSGVVGMGLCAAVDGMGSRVTIPRFDDARIPLYAASGLAAMAASGVSSLAHNILIPALAEEDKWTEGTSTAVALLSAGAGGAGAWAMMDPAILTAAWLQQSDWICARERICRRLPVSARRETDGVSIFPAHSKHDV